MKSMAQMSRNIFVLFLLCIVLLIIVGVSFPSYLASKNMKLRSTFNSSVVSFHALSSEKLISESPEADIINTSENTFQSNGAATKINTSLAIIDPSSMPVKVKRQAKRQTSSNNGSDLFEWKFNINVTRYRKANEGKSDDLNASVKHSGVAVYLESKEPKEIAFNEMEVAFKSVISFFRNFFKADFENAINDTKENKRVQYFTESSWVKPGHTTIDSFDDSTKALSKQPDMEEKETNHSLNESLQPSKQISSENIDELNLDGSNDSSIQTDREARIFFGLFNLVGKSLPKTTLAPETTLITAADDMDRNIEINENLTDPLPHEAIFVTENSQQTSSIHADSFKSETERSVKNPNEPKAEKSDIDSVTYQANCLSCNTDKTENPNFSNEQDSSKTVFETTRKPIEHLTDKTLRNLCMQILSNLEESRTPINGEEKIFENQLVSSQNLPIDSLNSPIPNEIEELTTFIEIGDNSLISSEELPTENTMLLGKQARFLSIFGLGSGRSEIINEGNLIFEKEPDEPNFTNLPSVSDCEKFSKDWIVERVPKLNHTSDLNTTPNINELLLEDNSNQTSENVKGEINSDEIKTSFRTEDLPELYSENTNTEENNSSSNELVESEIIDSKQKVQLTTDGQRDGRIFSFLNFGSGNGRDTGSFFGFFGSGMRSLNFNESDESNDLETSIPLQEKVFDDGYSFEKDYGVSVTSVKDPRLLGIFGLGGSGEGRELADDTDSITEYNAHIDCKNDCFHEATETPYKCNDGCDPENYDVTNSSADSINSSNDCEENCNTSITEIHSKNFENLTSESIGLDSFNSENFLLTKYPENRENTYFEENHGQFPSRATTEVFDLYYHSTEKLDYEQNTENSVTEHVTTEKNDRRFMGPIFLTGSGDGGLFGDDGGPINLVKEENTVGVNRKPRRRGRLEDTGFNDYIDGNSLNPFDISVEKPKSPVSNTQDFVPLTDGPKESLTDERGTQGFSPVTFLPSPNITQIQIKIQPRSCSGARDCNVTLNERCITISASSVCDCGRSFVRHKETGKCVAKRLVETSLKLPEESFDENLRNPASPRYKEMTEKSIETIYLLLNETPNILRIVTDVNVAGFASGSLIVKLNFVLAAEKDNPSQYLKDMENGLQKALRDQHVLEKASLNVRDASFQPLKSEINRCKSPDLNYCSKYADCMWNEDYPGGFLCKCKEHYLDVSTNSFYPGEICLAKCPASFCGSNGHCEVLGNDKRHCVCYGLYFGERCEYPGVVILGSLSIVGLISLIIIFVVIFKLRSRSTRYGRTPTFRRADTPGHAIANCRVSDAIALGESRDMKVSKFTHISTPVQEPPVIKVTRPTINESSISFDCDSTFDVSNYTDEKSV